MNETKQFLLLAKKENSQKQTFSLKSWAQLPLTHMTIWTIVIMQNNCDDWSKSTFFQAQWSSLE